MIGVQKIPSLTCKKCGSFKVMITDDGPECEECSSLSPAPCKRVSMSREVEYLDYLERQLNFKEISE
jgi:hypothetical protein